MNSEQLAGRLEPALDGPGVWGAQGGVDGTEQGMFEEPIELLRRFVDEKVELLISNLESRRFCFLIAQSDRGRRQIEAPGDESGLTPSAGVMAGAASRDGDGAAWESRVSGEKID